MGIYLCNRCKKVYIQRPKNEVVRCVIDHPPGDCCHYGEHEAFLYEECPICRADVKPKSDENRDFVHCTRCEFDTEKIFDEAFMTAVALGFDSISGEIYK